MAGSSNGGSRPSLPAAVRAFLETEAASGIVILIATVAALVWANSPWQHSYDSVWGGALGDIVNQGLMTIFFLVVGLEIRRELVHGDLRQPRSAALPALAAIGGMIVPVVMYAAINGGHPGSRGWGIPMATDIAFAAGVLALAGSRVNPSLKLFLLALAIVDDIGAIVVIAVFYSNGVHVAALAAAVALLGAVVVLRRRATAQLAVFALFGFAAWLATYESGVHATIVGVALALVAPAALVDRLEALLHPWSSFVIVPLFALANAGVTFRTAALHESGSARVIVGIAAGLVVGKTLGVTGASWLAVRTGVGQLPAGVERRQFVGVATVAGLGFTVSLFVSGLAFGSTSPLQDSAKIGILVGSTIAAVIGSSTLRFGRADAPPR